MNTFEKTLLWTIKIGLMAVALLPLYISSGMLFPFITGKNFFFRIIIEIIFALWAGLAVARPEFRPRLTWLFKSSTVFIVILFLADLFGPNPYRSFFSNYERMEGFMMLFHMYLFLVLLTSVIKKKKDWLIFFHVTLAASIIAGFIGLLQKTGVKVSIQGGYRVDSTIGNPSYFAAYLMFHVWILLLLIKRFWSNWWLRATYGIALVFELLIIYFTATRGASIALFIGAFLLLLFSVIFWKYLFPDVSAVYRRVGIGFLAFLLLLPILFWQFRNASWLPQNSAFSRLASISLSDTTTQSRFSIWGMSFKGFLERPVLGWGQENYYLVFQKYFDPKLYQSEPWFDRSHNIFFDWLVHAGILGFLAYASLWAVAGWMVMRIARGGMLWSGMVLGLVFVAHFIQNIFVFDNFNTYFLFFSFLAYTQFEFLSNQKGGGGSSSSQAAQKLPHGNSSLGYAVLLGLLVAVIMVSYFLSWKPMQESRFLIRALVLEQASHQQLLPIDQMIGQFQAALNYRTFGDTEVREQLANTARGVIANDRYSADDKKKFAEYAVEELQKELARPEKDIKHMLFLASILDRSAAFNPQNLLRAENLLRDAIAISPTKQIIYFELAQVYIAKNEINNAIDALEGAYRLEPSYQQAVVNLMIMAQLGNRPDLVQEAKKHVKITALDEDMLRRLSSIYQSTGDGEGILRVFLRLVEIAPANPQYHAGLATLLAQAGQVDRAIEEAKKAAELDKSYAPEAETFIQQLKQKGTGGK